MILNGNKFPRQCNRIRLTELFALLGDADIRHNLYIPTRSENNFAEKDLNPCFRARRAAAMAAPPSAEEESFLTLVIFMLSHVLNGYLTAFFVVTGIILNAFSIFIFLRCDRGGTPAIQYYLVRLVPMQKNREI